MTAAAGIDIGAGTAKVVILIERKVVSSCVSPTGHDSLETCRNIFDDSLKKANIGFSDLERIVSTGYSRNLVPFAHTTMTEIMCHAKGAHYLVPNVRTVIDIGCQDSKAIRTDEHGSVINFVMNDKCAAGTGRFIEVMAQALGLKIEEVGPAALKSHNYCDISSTCTVFAETEIISQRAQGRKREDLIAGALRAIAKRVSIMVSSVGLAEEVVFTGGVAKNIGVKKALEEALKVNILIPEDPQIVGAIGAALYACDQLESADHSKI